MTGASVTVTANWVARRLDFVSDFPELEAAFARTHPSDPRGEVEAVVGELYDVLARLRLGADVLERSIEVVPELARMPPRSRTRSPARRSAASPPTRCSQLRGPRRSRMDANGPAAMRTPS